MATPDTVDYASVCIANISGPERRRRLTFGVVLGIVSLGILAAMLLAHLDAAWRLALVLPIAAAATGFFQWRDKT